MACKEIMLLIITFFCFCASVSYTEITNLEQRLTNMEQVIEDRLNTTERILGQFLTGRNDANLAALDVLSLRTGMINKKMYTLYSYLIYCSKCSLIISKLIHAKKNSMVFFLGGGLLAN